MMSEKRTKLPTKHGGGSDGSLTLLRDITPLPQIDARIVFYDYVYVDERGTPQPNAVDIDHYGKVRDATWRAPDGWRLLNHKYFVDGRMMHESITSFIGKFHEPFDEAHHSARLAREAKPDSIYFGKTQEQIRAMWEENRVNGQRMHEYLEWFYNDMHDPSDARASQREFAHFLQFHEEFVVANDLVPLRTELRNFLTEPDCDTPDQLCGTADMLYMRRADVGDAERGGNVIIVDWKFLRRMYTSGFGGKRCYAPFDALDDCNLSHYLIQLNCYAYMLMQRTGLFVTDMWVADFGESQAKYQLYPVRDLQREVQLAIAVRREQFMTAHRAKRARLSRAFLGDLDELLECVRDADEQSPIVRRAVALKRKFEEIREADRSLDPLLNGVVREHQLALRRKLGLDGQTKISNYFTEALLSK